MRVRPVQNIDYSPFGVQLSGRNFTAAAVSKKYRMGYQGSEMDNEVKGEGNSYTTFFRQLDPRLGRWLTIDPVVQPWQSPYCSMDNNPIWYNDPKGNIVDKERGEGVSRKEFRQFKKDIRQLIKHSATYRTMYNDLNARKETYTLRAINSTEGNANDPYVIEIGIHQKMNNPLDPPQSLRDAQMGLIAHETAHKFRALYNLDSPMPLVPHKGADLTEWNQYNTDRFNHHSESERGAAHIENIVRGELQKVHKFRDISFQRYYAPAYKLLREWTRKGYVYTSEMQKGTYDTFDNGIYSEDYYKKNINVYEELGIIINYSKLFKSIQSGKLYY